MRLFLSFVGVCKLLPSPTFLPCFVLDTFFNRIILCWYMFNDHLFYAFNFFYVLVMVVCCYGQLFCVCCWFFYFLFSVFFGLGWFFWWLIFYCLMWDKNSVFEFAVFSVILLFGCLFCCLFSLYVAVVIGFFKLISPYFYTLEKVVLSGFEKCVLFLGVCFCGRWFFDCFYCTCFICFCLSLDIFLRRFRFSATCWIIISLVLLCFLWCWWLAVDAVKYFVSVTYFGVFDLYITVVVVWFY